MQEWIRRLNQAAEDKTDTMLVVTVKRDGSTPGAINAKMLVDSHGHTFGTIGGGQLEHRCIERAVELIAQQRCAVEQYDLNAQHGSDLGMICGGSATVWFHYLKESALPSSPGTSAWLLLEQDGLGQGRACISSDAKPDFTLKQEKRGFEQFPDGSARYWENLSVNGTVYIFGAGHVAQALVPALARVGFSCIVLDDRPEYLNHDLFPDAQQVTRIGPESLKKICTEIHSSDYVCVMTHGHRYDHEVVRRVLRTPACYIGVIGSKRKAQVSAQLLLEEGFDYSDIERLHTPIGLSIGAETPEEIAVSITAQLIETRAHLRHK